MRLALKSGVLDDKKMNIKVSQFQSLRFLLDIHGMEPISVSLSLSSPLGKCINPIKLPLNNHK
jgi:hypothetical protein